jgi:hypothetical protein
VCRFGHDHVVVVLTTDVKDVKVAALGIDAVCVEGEHGDSADEVVAFEDAELGGGVDLDIDVVDDSVDGLVKSHVIAGRIFED